MFSSERISAYHSLLKIRRTAYRRNVFIIGGLLVLVLLATLALGLLTAGDSRTLTIMAGFTIVFILSFMRAWTQLEVVKGNIELIEQIQNLET